MAPELRFYRDNTDILFKEEQKKASQYLEAMNEENE